MIRQIVRPHRQWSASVASVASSRADPVDAMLQLRETMHEQVRSDLASLCDLPIRQQALRQRVFTSPAFQLLDDVHFGLGRHMGMRSPVDNSVDQPTNGNLDNLEQKAPTPVSANHDCVRRNNYKHALLQRRLGDRQVTFPFAAALPQSLQFSAIPTERWGAKNDGRAIKTNNKPNPSTQGVTDQSSSRSDENGHNEEKQSASPPTSTFDSASEQRASRQNPVVDVEAFEAFEQEWADICNEFPYIRARP
jgi:hypothetical protein